MAQLSTLGIAAERIRARLFLFDAGFTGHIAPAIACFEFAPSEREQFDSALSLAPSRAGFMHFIFHFIYDSGRYA